MANMSARSSTDISDRRNYRRLVREIGKVEIYLSIICIFKATKFKDIYPLSIQNSNSGIAAAAGIVNSGDKKRGEKVKKEKEEPIRNLLSFATQPPLSPSFVTNLH
ncbi:hypothetical protein WUBG_04892 [Wuchereria bancrofti]|uniref:Uncharacterized protein n=1 Tax=Wuchereria bancrofti TaxID=6293 RepID=J9EPT1_WUCBA|nr:hypothetical protein WUBG_04892 [Wuchereria bancrofti]